MPELQVLNGSLQWKTIPLSGERFLIGRKENCHLILKDGWVSREHTLIIEPSAGEYRVQDLDSENGTFLNGEKIRDVPLKHGDILRVGRTEMRFTQRPGSTPQLAMPRVQVNVEEDQGAGLRTLTGADTEARDYGEQTLKVDPMSKTSTDDAAKSDGPRIDLRERVRRLEARLLDGEQANAALAAENAVLKRALARLGVLDRATGTIDPTKLTPQAPGVASESMLRLVTNPLARITFPGESPAPHAAGGNSNPAVFDFGLVGVDALGIRFAECVSKLGYRRAAAVTCERDAMRGGVIDPAWRIHVDRPKGVRSGFGPAAADDVFIAAMPRIEEAFGDAFKGCDRVLLCADATAPLAPEGLMHFAEVLRRMGVNPGGVMFFDPREDNFDAHARAEAAFATGRMLAESGRLAPFVVIDVVRAGRLCGAADAGDPTLVMLDSVAGILETVFRLPTMPAAGSQVEAQGVLEILLAKGWSTLGVAQAESTTRGAIEAAYAQALGTGLLAGAMPASRSRAAFIAAIAGLATPGSECDPDAMRATVAKLLPQAQRLEALYRDGRDSVRVIAFVGGLPYPETFFSEKNPGSSRRDRRG